MYKRFFLAISMIMLGSSFTQSAFGADKCSSIKRSVSGGSQSADSISCASLSSDKEKKIRPVLKDLPKRTRISVSGGSPSSQWLEFRRKNR